MKIHPRRRANRRTRAMILTAVGERATGGAWLEASRAAALLSIPETADEGGLRSDKSGLRVRARMLSSTADTISRSGVEEAEAEEGKPKKKKKFPWRHCSRRQK